MVKVEWKGLPKLGQGPSDFKSLDEVSSQAVGMGTLVSDSAGEGTRGLREVGHGSVANRWRVGEVHEKATRKVDIYVLGNPSCSSSDVTILLDPVLSQFNGASVKNMTTIPDGAWYLGMAFPFTLLHAVGGYDVSDRPRLRRPEHKDLPTPRRTSPNWLQPQVGIALRKLPDEHLSIGPAPTVQLSDLTRGLAQCMEGQFRRSWGYTPTIWNLFFRQCVNLGASLSIQRQQQFQDRSAASVETDAAIAAADLVLKLEHGDYKLPDGRFRNLRTVPRPPAVHERKA